MCSLKRGALIVFEGCDKTGKTTQSKLLVERLNKANIQAEYMRFPDRTTAIGELIDRYLQGTVELENHAARLLFSANHWEARPRMGDLLKSGKTLIVDRYSYSGLAYSSANHGLDMEWCRGLERGMLKPDKVFYLKVSLEEAANRGDFGAERFETADIQKKVAAAFEEMKEGNWIEFDADKTVEELSEELYSEALKVIENAETQEIGELWE